MTQRDYYEVLGVDRRCGEPDLNAAFRKLAMEHHPDRNDGCEEAAGRFKEINEAYTVLRDPQKRAAYDRFGHAGVQGQGGGAGFTDVHDIFNEVFGQAFGDMFGTKSSLHTTPCNRLRSKIFSPSSPNSVSSAASVARSAKSTGMYTVRGTYCWSI